MVVISNDNPFIPVTPGITRRLEFTFHRKCYIRMPELTTPYEFAMVNIDGLTAANMINGYEYSNRKMTIEFLQLTRVAYVRNDEIIPSLATFVDWDQFESYMTNSTIRFFYGMMTLNDSAAKTNITYTTAMVTKVKMASENSYRKS